MKKLATKNNAVLMLVLAVVSLTGSYFMQYVLDMQPCPLCIMQRFCSVMLTFLCLMYFIFECWPKRWSFLNLQLVFISLGLVSASRQLWLQLFAKDDGSLCMPGFEELIHYFSWDIILKVMFWGSNDCAATPWKFFGLPISVLSLVFFILMLLLWVRQVMLLQRK
jgi:disulfide bond formation protein DsbB